MLTVEKVDRISQALDEQKRAIDELSLKRMRPALGRDGRAMPSEHKSAFDAYMRSGDDRLMRALDTKAMSYGSGQDGGYLVPDETEAEIGKRLAVLSPIRSIASVRQVSAAVLKKPFSITGPAVGWVAETAARPQTNYADAGRAAVPDDGALRHAGGDAPRCSTTRWSTSTSGSPARWRPPSPSRKARPS